MTAFDDWISEDEGFELGLRAFIDAVASLASSPQSCCKRYGYYNVAWEIKDDVGAGRYLTEHFSNRFDDEQHRAVKALLEALEAVPAEVTAFTKVDRISLEQMQHAAWEPARVCAAAILQSFGEPCA
jgi:hypothetical protein